MRDRKETEDREQYLCSHIAPLSSDSLWYLSTLNILHKTIVNGEILEPTKHMCILAPVIYKGYFPNVHLQVNFDPKIFVHYNSGHELEGL